MLTEPRHAVTRPRGPVPDDRARVSALRLWGAATLGVFVVLTVIVATKASQATDQSIDDSLNRFALHHSGVTDVFKTVTNLGAPTVTLALGLLVAGTFFALRMRSSAYFAAASVVGAYGIAYVVKKGVNRHRPIWDAAHTISTESGASFPSGHATGTSTLVAVLILAAVPILGGAAGAGRAALSGTRSAGLSGAEPAGPSGVSGRPADPAVRSGAQATRSTGDSAQAMTPDHAMASAHATHPGQVAASGSARPVARRAAITALTLYAIAIVASRPLLGVHFPTDVLAGAALGTGWTLLCASILRPWQDRPSAG